MIISLREFSSQTKVQVVSTLTARSHSPPLRGAQVFGGIAGIIGESRDQEDLRSQHNDLSATEFSLL